MNRLLSALFPFLLLVGLWWLVIIALEVPHFILPSPDRVARVLVERLPLDQWSRIHNCVGNRLWSHAGYCARFCSRMPHR